MDLKERGFSFLLTMLMSMMGVEAFAHDIAVANADGVTIYYTYTNNNTELAVSYRGRYYDSYSNEYTGDVVIPSTVTYNGTTYSVTSIGYDAFLDCTGLTSVTIGNSVTNIGTAAFSGCNGLKNVTIPNSVTSIGLSAFEGCSSLANITIPNSVTYIGKYAFYDTSWYKNQPDGVVYAGKVAYRYKGEMPSNTSIVLEEGTKGIAYTAFSGCNNLASITIPNTVTTIGEYAFYCCTGLTSLNIPNSVINIGNEAFSETAWYNNFPDGVVYAGKVAYKYKGTMPDNTNIMIEEGSVGIASNAFAHCTGLNSISIPNSVTNIGNSAFQGCVGLASIDIPSSVTSIGNGVFVGCNSLISVSVDDNNPYYDSRGKCNAIIETPTNILVNGCRTTNIPNSVTSIGDYAFSKCYGLTSIDIPNSVTSIGSNAYSGCSGLTSVVIPNSVNSIESDAFGSCTELVDFYCYATQVPATDEYAFSSTPLGNVTLHVPFESIAAYQSQSPWSGFGTITSIENQHKLTITASGKHGTVSYDGANLTGTTKEFYVVEGSNAELTIIPEEGFKINTVTVNGEDKTSEVSGGVLTLSNVTANMTVNVSFTFSGETTDVTIGAAGMATFCSAYDVDFTNVDDVKAYIGSGFNRTTGQLLMTRVYDVPAGTGLLLMGKPGTYVVPQKASPSVYASLLVGCPTATTISQTSGTNTNYILGEGSHGVGFYLVDGTGELAAGRAYLQLPATASHSRRMVTITFDEGTTDVSNALRINDQEEMIGDKWHTLDGRMLIGKPTAKGIYVHNGQKTVIR